jgi:acetate kinase
VRVLVFNGGSSSLKFRVFEVASRAGGNDCVQSLIRGRVKFGMCGALETWVGGGSLRIRSIGAESADAAARSVLDWLEDEPRFREKQLEAVGHRIVHGGADMTKPAILTDEVMESLSHAIDLAPVHNQPALDVIGACRSRFDGRIPMVATFDTTFHAGLPQYARRYAIPEEPAAKHKLWRYGFHGLAHRWMMERYARLAGRPADDIKLITLQLGGGCSAAAIRGGRSVETSMGLTPLEGLMMPTRSGDVDPSLPVLLAKKEGLDPQQVESLLNTQSGLMGVYGHNRDVTEILAAEQQGDQRAALALQMFCHRIRKYVGGYLAVLEGADAVLFGGGIGENVPPIRARICSGFNWAGLELDPLRNDSVVAKESRISARHSAMEAYVIPVNEEELIARDTCDCLESGSKEGRPYAHLRR